MCPFPASEAIQSCFASLPLRDMTTAHDEAVNTHWFIVRQTVTMASDESRIACPYLKSGEPVAGNATL
jgi:hypothetical protein